MKHLLCFFILCFQGMTYAQEGCSEVIEKLEIGPTDNLFSYLMKLYRKQKISSKSIEKFYQELGRGKLINPVDHEMNSWGPTFDHSSKRLSYLQIQKYIDAYEADHQFISLPELKQKMKTELGQELERMTQKKMTSKETNFDLLMELVSDHKEILVMMEDQLMNLSEKLRSELAEKLLEKNDSKKLLELGYKLLARTSQRYTWEKVESLLWQSPQKDFAQLQELIIDDGSQEFQDFILRMVNSNYPDQYKIVLLKKVKNIQGDIWRNTLEKILSLEGSYTYKEELLPIYTGIASDSVIPFLKGLVYENANADRYTRANALISLINLGQGEEVFSEANILKLGLVKGSDLDEEVYQTEAYRALVIKIVSAGLRERDDENSLKAVLALRKNARDLFDENMFDLLEGRTDPETLNIVKNLYIVFPTVAQLKNKISLLSGREDDWSLKFLERNSRYFGIKNDQLMQMTIYALSGEKEIRSREVLENFLLEAIDNKIQFFQDAAIQALKGRPSDDIIYFINKYHHKFNTLEGIDYLVNAFEYINGIDSSSAVEIAKMYLNGPHRNIKIETVLNYIFSLPREKYLPLWRELAQKDKLHNERAVVLRKMIGFVEDEDRLIFEKILKSSEATVIHDLALSGYLYQYFYYRDQLSSNDPSKVEMANKMIEKMDLNLMLGVMKKK